MRFFIGLLLSVGDLFFMHYMFSFFILCRWAIKILCEVSCQRGEVTADCHCWLPYNSLARQTIEDYYVWYAWRVCDAYEIINKYRKYAEWLWQPLIPDNESESQCTERHGYFLRCLLIQYFSCVFLHNWCIMLVMPMIIDMMLSIDMGGRRHIWCWKSFNNPFCHTVLARWFNDAARFIV